MRRCSTGCPRQHQPRTWLIRCDIHSSLLFRSSPQLADILCHTTCPLTTGHHGATHERAMAACWSDSQVCPQPLPRPASRAQLCLTQSRCDAGCLPHRRRWQLAAPEQRTVCLAAQLLPPAAMRWPTACACLRARYGRHGGPGRRSERVCLRLPEAPRHCRPVLTCALCYAACRLSPAGPARLAQQLRQADLPWGDRGVRHRGPGRCGAVQVRSWGCASHAGAGFT